MKIILPKLSLVLLIGPSGSGKSTFARRHFRPTEVVSSDVCRGLISDDENDQAVSAEAFDLLHTLVAKRLKLGRLTVVDATNVDPKSRQQLLAISKKYHCLAVAIVFKIPERVCHERNKKRVDRDFGPQVIRRQSAIMRRGLRGLKREGFHRIYRFESEEDIVAVEGIEREPLWNDQTSLSGPFDIIGDVHGCYDELIDLLEKLGYEIHGETARHPERTLVFVGDLIDRGPASPAVLRLVMASLAAGTAFCVPGNHDVKLQKHLRGKRVTLNHGLDLTVAQLEKDPLDPSELADFIYRLVSHLVFDGGRLVVAHAGIKKEMIGRGSGAVREMCLYGDTTGEFDEDGLPVRLDWAAQYRGKALVVYGHTPVAEPRWLNGTVNIDTGCVFGGKLTALRYPEQEVVSVPARQAYAEVVRDFLPKAGGLSPQQEADSKLPLADVSGTLRLETRYLHHLTVREEYSAAALEVMSRFAVDPRWLIYLPPTMSPCATSERQGWLERPEEAFAYYRENGQSHIICEEKHMGSRAVVTIVRDEETARIRFGVMDGSLGVITTRTGRPFFRDVEMTRAILDRLRAALDAMDFWKTYETNWACLDCEIMPWSAKARDLLVKQYAPVATVAESYLEKALALTHGHEHEEVVALRGRLEARAKNAESYREAYRNYCWETPKLDDYQLAPFHLLATEGQVHVDQCHRWHMDFAAALAKADPALFQRTTFHEVNLDDADEVEQAISWWEGFTASGGEGMVVKPRGFLASGERGLLQPAVKCRGKDYLRIIYGPDYTEEANLLRLRQRGLGRKRSLALREFALGLEALHRFVERAPLREVHQHVFAVLALESEPVDPRL